MDVLPELHPASHPAERDAARAKPQRTRSRVERGMLPPRFRREGARTEDRVMNALNRKWQSCCGKVETYFMNLRRTVRRRPNPSRPATV